MSQRVQTTKEERETIARQFSTIVTTLYDEYIVFDGGYDIKFAHKEAGLGGNPVPFTRDHVKITQVWSDNENKIAHIAHDNDDYWKLGIRFADWRDLSPYRRFKTLVHEAAHLPDPTNDHLGLMGRKYDFDVNGVEGRKHPLRFWLTYAMLGDRINDRRHLLHTDLYGVAVTGGPVICDALNNARRYASGIENADKWMQAILDRVDYPGDHYRVFGDRAWHGYFNERFADTPDEDDLDEVPVHKVDFEMPTDADLYDEFGDDFEVPDTDDHWDTPRIELPRPPRVRETRKKDDEVLEYDVVDGDEYLFALLARRLRSTVECEVTRRL